ncbi:helix-turn-helix transcriptional regulator [Erysipelothrix sp. HDW6C]|uniref:helix-turn-helix transcriptional regulator n=1 Tax=Erysipelothrix sp. HDW6C TaxID=2714930 RepID=UPI00140B2E89|nr:AraC family transcriptional regulator [Erysipelothrix sp. HDW6C]QIK69524.1 helix-turn-helix transcriptional regulator [Erysipelothrix sp. HDW6C]
MNYTQLIHKAEDYIEMHLDEPIRLAPLAKHIGVSSYHFHRIFKMHSQETLQQYISRVKMERAGIYLYVHQSVTITEMAQNYGYADASAFNKAFRRHFGMSPTQFRKRKI